MNRAFTTSRLKKEGVHVTKDERLILVSHMTGSMATYSSVVYDNSV